MEAANSTKKPPEMETARRRESERSNERADNEAVSRLESKRSAKERVEKAAARRALLDSLSRRGLLRSQGSILINLDNCDEIRDTIDFDRFLGLRM